MVGVSHFPGVTSMELRVARVERELERACVGLSMTAHPPRHTHAHTHNNNDYVQTCTTCLPGQGNEVLSQAPSGGVQLFSSLEVEGGSAWSSAHWHSTMEGKGVCL
eukprot:m.16764 g.16764  ORF g.16764 m.16764 type:complete len:106 (-) comp9102_c0_seq1:306-623(-)